jgi:hypothetical protein
MGSLSFEISKSLEPKLYKKIKEMPNSCLIATNSKKKNLSFKPHKVQELCYPINVSSPTGTSYKKVLALKIVKILILFAKFLRDLILEGDFFVTSFVF